MTVQTAYGLKTMGTINYVDKMHLISLISDALCRGTDPVGLYNKLGMLAVEHAVKVDPAENRLINKRTREEPELMSFFSLKEEQRGNVTKVKPDEQDWL